ncbi:hypothetical protein AB0C98_10975 [Streptomyces sp. NPDC048558]|uniref:hypothetical protein n=1 Tax=Streptomyces sp. NPDC048558 TaxID=3155759 RepID=UPI0033E45F1A
MLNTVTSGAPADTPSYTGARYEPTTGNLDLHARQYNTTTGRFTAPTRQPPTAATRMCRRTPTPTTSPAS